MIQKSGIFSRWIIQWRSPRSPILKPIISGLIHAMTASATQIVSFDEFLILPYIEDSPAWEFVDGVAMQKPMPKTRHSLLQKRFLTEIDRHSDDYTALPELRCTFAGRSPASDIRWNISRAYC
ncbi:MAG: Uma2 family endonuclease [Elainellaceae cyanobacterium]